MGTDRAYKEYIKKPIVNLKMQKVAWKSLMLIFVEFGKMKKNPGGEEVQLQVKDYKTIFRKTFITVQIRF